MGQVVIHDSSMGQVVIHDKVLGDPIVPQCGVIDTPCPAQSELKLDLIREEEVQHCIALHLPQVYEMTVRH